MGIEIVDQRAFLSLAFLIIFLFYTVYSGFFIYHWHAFGIKKSINTMSTLIYLIGSGLLILAMALSIFSIN